MIKKHNTKFIDLTGKIFGNLTVLQRTKNTTYGHPRYLCQCKCGMQKEIIGQHLKSGASSSCGCIQRAIASTYNSTHGLSGTRTYKIWKGMHKRCSNENSSGFYKYGARGIHVDKKWNSFEQFFRYMGHPPTPHHSIERKNNNMGYSKKNCKWATMKEQSRNTRSNNFIEFSGIRLCVTDWAIKLKMNPDTLFMRIRRGFSTKQILRPFTTKISNSSRLVHVEL